MIQQSPKNTQIGTCHEPIQSSSHFFWIYLSNIHFNIVISSQSHLQSVMMFPNLFFVSPVHAMGPNIQSFFVLSPISFSKYCEVPLYAIFSKYKSY